MHLARAREQTNRAVCLIVAPDRWSCSSPLLLFGGLLNPARRPRGPSVAISRRLSSRTSPRAAEPEGARRAAPSPPWKKTDRNQDGQEHGRGDTFSHKRGPIPGTLVRRFQPASSDNNGAALDFQRIAGHTCPAARGSGRPASASKARPRAINQWQTPAPPASPGNPWDLLAVGELRPANCRSESISRGRRSINKLASGAAQGGSRFAPSFSPRAVWPDSSCTI